MLAVASFAMFLSYLALKQKLLCCFVASPQIRAGTVALLYVSPERFNNERFVNALKGVKVALFVVDEAHCISEVGEHGHNPCRHSSYGGPPV